MPRKTLIFGNGLGMALNPEHFSLDSAIGEVWNDEALLDQANKLLVCKCLSDNEANRPHGEEDLDTLQLVLSACEFLSHIGDDEIHWLSDNGRDFPEAVRKFIYQAARYFYNHQLALPIEFIGSLSEFINNSKSHVATLNYDNLLYQPLIHQGVLDGYNGALVDGFFKTGFNPKNMARRFGRTFGYYLHLHGSPLFVNRGRRTIKLTQAEVVNQDDTISSHIVLTHFKHKPTVISASSVLSAYWKLLPEAMDESEEIIVAGYSGLDTHLNALLRQFNEKPIRIVEWDGAGTYGERSIFWKETTRTEVTLVQMENILEFEDW
jgi:hypothetical protein